MKNSEKFIARLTFQRILFGILIIFGIGMLINYSISIYYSTGYSILDIKIMLFMALFLILLLVVIGILKLFVYDERDPKEIESVCNELNYNVNKVFEKYGIYLTDNYLVCFGRKANIVGALYVPLKDITDIYIGSDRHMRYSKTHKKISKKVKNKFLSFAISSGVSDFYKDIEFCGIWIGTKNKTYSISRRFWATDKYIDETHEIAKYIDKYLREKDIKVDFH